MEKYIIFTNKIRCKKCGDIIESTWVHDFKQCKCGAVAVDGGHEYMKRLGNVEDWEELSEWQKVIKEVIKEEDEMLKEYMDWNDIVEEYCKIPFDALVDSYWDGGGDHFSMIDYEDAPDYFEYSTKEEPFHNFLLTIRGLLVNSFDAYEALKNPFHFANTVKLYPIDDVYAIQTYNGYRDDMYRFVREHWKEIVNGEMVDPIDEYKLSIDTNPFAWLYDTKLVNLSLDEDGNIKPIRNFLDKVYSDSYLKLLKRMENIINTYEGKRVIVISGKEAYVGCFKSCKVIPNWGFSIIDRDGCEMFLEDEFAHYFFIDK